MYSNRVLGALLLGVGLTVTGAGCAAVDALVNSPAGNSATRSNSSRMAAIGRVFENQGRYAKAQSMYRSALKADPKNTIARERMLAIANRKNSGKLKSVSDSTEEAVALADDLSSPQERRFVSQKPVSNLKSIAQAKPVETVPVPAAKDANEQDASVIASLTPIALDGSDANGQDEAEPTIVTVSSDVGEVDVVDLNWELGELAGEFDDSWDQIEISPAATVFDETAASVVVAPVGFEGDDTGVTTLSSTASEWKSAARIVSLDELVVWYEDPETNQAKIISAIRNGADEGVQALAASALVSCPLGDADVNAALSEASHSDVEIIRVTALDSLVQRQELNGEDLNRLLMSLGSQHADIRTLAAAAVRNLSETNWAPECVAALTELLQDDSSDVVMMAAATLGDFGVDAMVSRDALTQLTAHESDDVARAAQLALLRIPATSVQGAGEAVTLPPVTSVEEETESSVGEYLPIVE